MRASINFFVVAVVAIMESVSLSIELSELVDSLCGIGSLGVNGLPGVSGLSVGVGVQDGLVDECCGEGMEDPSRVLSDDGCGVSFGCKSVSGDNGCSGDL